MSTYTKNEESRKENFNYNSIIECVKILRNQFNQEVKFLHTKPF